MREIGSELVYSNFVRAETHTLLLNRADHWRANYFLATMKSSGWRGLQRVTEADEDSALEILQKLQDKDLSLVDTTSFAMMHRLHLTHALAFDKDFKQYGQFVVL